MNTTKTLIALLVIVAVVLGIIVVLKIAPASMTQQQSGSTTTTPAPFSQSAPAKPDLTTDEHKALTPPAAGGEQAYSDLLNKVAKDTTTVSIGTQCSMSPVVTRVAPGSTITVKNADTNGHTIAFDKQHTYTIAAGASKDVKLDFYKANTAYGYGCDASSGPAGIMLIEVKK